MKTQWIYSIMFRGFWNMTNSRGCSRNSQIFRIPLIEGQRGFLLRNSQRILKKTKGKRKRRRKDLNIEKFWKEREASFLYVKYFSFWWFFITVRMTKLVRAWLHRQHPWLKQILARFSKVLPRTKILMIKTTETAILVLSPTIFKKMGSLRKN